MDLFSLLFPIALQTNDVVFDWQKVGSGAVMFVLVVIGAFTVFLAAASFLRFHHIIAMERDTEDLEPAEAFYIRIVRRIANVRSNNPFCLVLISARLRPAEGEAGSRPADRDAVLEKIASNLRSADDGTLYEDNLIAFSIQAGPAEMRGVKGRLDKQIAQMRIADKDGVAREVDLRMGCAFFPKGADSIDELFANAQSMLENAQSAAEMNSWKFDLDLPEPAAEEEEEGEQNLPSYIDPVTGLLKPERASSTAQKFISQYRREGADVSILLIEIDDAKRYTKDYGEDAIDSLRKAMSERMESCLRENDLLACWGNDGFVAGIDGNAECAAIVAKRLLKAFQSEKAQHGEYRLRLKVSIGSGSYPDHKHLPRDIIRAAEMALQAASRKGKNIHCAFDPKMEQHEKERERREVF